MALPSSADQEAECLRVLTSANHFEVLQLEVAFVECDVVRKHYKRIALRVHPDKNSSPEAEQAFKAVSLAYDCLCDSDDQQQYLDELTHGRHSKHFDHSSASPSRHSKAKSYRRSDEPYIPKQKWWEHKSWDEVEAEIKRQEAAWKERIAGQVAEYQERKEMKAAYRKRRHARVHQRLAPLYAKYGLMDEFSERNGELKQDAKESTEAVYAKRNIQSYQSSKCASASSADTYSGTLDSAVKAIAAICDSTQETSHSSSRPSHSGAKHSPSSAAQPEHSQLCSDNQEASKASAAGVPVVCQLCSRQFRDQGHLREHVQFSKLHQTNLQKYMQQAAKPPQVM